MFLSDKQKTVIGMVHLLPLPGSPHYQGSLTNVLNAALRDVDALATGGVHALMLENFGDVPFHPARVPAHVVAAMTALAAAIRERFDLPLGINVLRNDGQAALAVAAATGAAFIRVNVLCGARLADQGILHGIAHDLLRDRAFLRADHVKILADVDVKHSAPLAPRDLKDEVEDTLHRGLADALIVSGAGTGKSTEIETVRRVKSFAPRAPLLVGSGITADTISDYLPTADGFIVGTALKAGGIAANPVDVSRVRELMRRL
jgi:membrane complex biogenesis BtpA family protein